MKTIEITMNMSDPMEFNLAIGHHSGGTKVYGILDLGTKGCIAIYGSKVQRKALSSVAYTDASKKLVGTLIKEKEKRGYQFGWTTVAGQDFAELLTNAAILIAKREIGGFTELVRKLQEVMPDAIADPKPAPQQINRESDYSENTSWGAF